MPLQVAFAVPFALALLGAVLSLVADAFGRGRLAITASALGLGLGACVAGVAAFTVAPERVWTIFVVGAGFSTGVAVVMALGALAVAAALSAEDSRSTELGGLIAISAVALAALASTIDVIVMLLALETAAVAGYALVALARTPRAHEAALKYFIQGAIATALYVFGVAGAVVSGALSFEGGRLAFTGAITDIPAATTAVVLLLAAFAFKLSAFPFHSWAPDAYETAPPEATVFLSSAVKLAALVATYLVMTSFMAQPQLTVRVQWLVAGLAAGSIVFGNLAALAQRSYARLLAYSGIAQIGYGLIAVVTGNGNGALMFATAYGCAAAGAFAVARAYRRIEPDWDGSIATMAGLSSRAPVLSASLAVLLFSLTGIPPLFGFWAKFLVFLSAATSPQWLWLVVLGLLGSVVSFGYYGRVLRAVYFDDVPEPAEADAAAGDNPARRRGVDAATAIAVALAVVILVTGLLPLFVGLSRFIGADPIGIFVISL